MKYIYAIVLIIFLGLNVANAQYFQTGQDPSHIRWRQANSENFQVIYPEEFENEAQRLLVVLSRVYEYGTKTLDFKPRKISVLLHSQTANSNGLVAWAPKRMELYTTPHQDIYAQDWLEQLAIHEFRHVVQLDKIQSELPFLLKFILGEQATAIVTGLYLPVWFLEGDAVVAETALSHSGRGRMASFSMEYRAQLIEKGKYSYDKAYLGSYKDFVPDHYKLGYWLVGKTREKYGFRLWSDVLDNIGSKPLSVTPFNAVLKKKTGSNTEQVYNQVFTDLTHTWKQEFSTEANNRDVATPQRKSYTNYLYPEFYQDSLIVAYRMSINDIGRFVLIRPDKSEKVIYTPGTIYDESVSINGHWIAWAERKPDIRWSHADKSVISVFDINTGVKHQVQHENNLFSPAISPGLTSFAAVEVDKQNNFYLSVFDLATGKLIQRFKTNDNQYLFTPCWDAKGEKLYFVCLSSQGKYLASYNLQTKHFQQVTSVTYANISNPVYISDKLVFSSDFAGKDRLYSLDLATQKIYQLYDAGFGADYPSSANSKNQLVFSDYSSGGYQIARLDLNTKAHVMEVTDISLQSNQLADNLAAQEDGIPDLRQTDSLRYTSKRYSRIANLFNFHSWAPAYIDIDSYEVRPGLSAFSQNTLGTADTRFGYDYDVTNQTGRYKIDFNYYGLFPEINTSLSYGKGSTNYYQITTYSNPNIKADTTVQSYNWNQLVGNVDVRLPLNFSRGKYSTGFFPEIKYTYNRVEPTDWTSTKKFYPESYHALSYRLYHYHLLRQSSRNLMPRWGYQLDLVLRHTPFVGKDLGMLKGIQTILYFPGFTKNGGFRIYQGYQQNTFSQSSAFGNFVRSPRGIRGYQNNEMYSLATDYRMPLAYPDMNIGKLVYLKRIKSSFFYDYAWLSVPVYDRNHELIPNHHQVMFNSLGLELNSDLHFLRFFAPFEIGFRSIYLPNSNSFRFNLLFSVDFNAF